MALHTKIKHVDKLPNGVLRFRRRFPKDVIEVIGQRYLQVHMRNREGLAFHREYQAILSEVERIVRQAREQLQRNGVDNRTKQEKWRDALLRGEELVNGVVGLDEANARDVLVDTLKDEDPLVMRAIKNPSAPPPKATLRDAFKLYRRDKRIEEGSKQDVDLTRVAARVEAALGDLDGLPLEDMEVAHRRRYLDHILSAKKADGSRMTC